MNGIAAALNALYKNLKTISIFIVIIHRAIFLLKTMDCYCIAGVVIFILLIAALIIVIKRDSINRFFSKNSSKEETMVGGAKKRPRVKYTKHKSKMSNIHHNKNARYIFIYLSDVYPKGLKEGLKFKSIIERTKYKNEAYAVYERPCNGSWVDTLNIDEAWDDFKRLYGNTFNKEISNGARLIFIGKGFGSVYAKIFMAAAKKTGYDCMAISLNGIHLREFLPALIVDHLGLSDININDIEFTDTKCVYKGKDYVKTFKINPKLYLLLFVCDSLSTDNYYSFYGIDGTRRIEMLPFKAVYENTYLMKYGKRFTINDWLKNPKLMETAIKKVI